MFGNAYGHTSSSRSPPPLQHPIPTHPHFIPEPPDTPVTGGTEPQGYMRFSSEQQRPPINAFAHQQPSGSHFTGAAPVPGANPAGPYGLQKPPMNPYGAYPQPGIPPMGQMGAPAYGMQPGMGGPLPDMSMWGVNDATAQLGMQLGRSAVQAGQQYVQQNFGSWILPMAQLKQSFNVSNSYVSKKLRLLIFPWRHRSWNRRILRSASPPHGDPSQPRPTQTSTETYLSPRDDINSPDLYIPSMSLTTYILLGALRAGLTSKFHPDVLGVTASKAISVLILEFLIVKLGCYFLNVPGQSQVVDLFSYGGYKFVGSTVIVLVGMLGFGGSIYWLVFLYLFTANAFFLLRSLRTLVLHDPAANPANPYTPAQRSYRVIFLFTVALMQIPFMLTLAWV